MISSQRP